MGKMGNLKVPEGFSLGTEHLGTAEAFPRPIEEALVRFRSRPGSYQDYRYLGTERNDSSFRGATSRLGSLGIRSGSLPPISLAGPGCPVQRRSSLDRLGHLS